MPDLPGSTQELDKAMFDYIIESHGKREIIKSYPISKDKRYLNFILEGTFTDNLGNYGIWDNASILTLQNKNVINLQGYGKSTYQKIEIFLFYLLTLHIPKYKR